MDSSTMKPASVNRSTASASSYPTTSGIAFSFVPNKEGKKMANKAMAIRPIEIPSMIGHFLRFFFTGGFVSGTTGSIFFVVSESSNFEVSVIAGMIRVLSSSKGTLNFASCCLSGDRTENKSSYISSADRYLYVASFAVAFKMTFSTL